MPLIKTLVGVVAIAAVLAGSIAATSLLELAPEACSAPQHDRGHDRVLAPAHRPGHGHGHRRQHLMVGPTCNTVEMVAPPESDYVPDIAGASRADRAKARKLLRGANDFCRTHSPATLRRTWTPGTGAPFRPSHLFNPRRRQSLGLDPSHPRAALIYQGQVGGVMLTGVPLPSLGSIPRAHTHDASAPREMVHVYCTANLAEAFTPNRILGVMADVLVLRPKMRLAVADLPATRLRTVLAEVRRFAGRGHAPVLPVSTRQGRGPSPLLQAKRQEIRRGLIELTEAELRTVWALMRST